MIIKGKPIGYLSYEKTEAAVTARVNVEGTGWKLGGIRSIQWQIQKC